MRSLFLFLTCLWTVHAVVIPVSLYGKPEDRINGEYLVKFRADARGHFRDFLSVRLQSYPGAKMAVHNFGGFMGVWARLTQEHLFNIQRLEGVEHIEPNTRVRMYDEQTGVQAWGIDRIDQRNLPLNELYRWDEPAGYGSEVYVLDTGIDTTHPDFGGRAFFEADCTQTFGACSMEKDPGDPQGHGTHCAGTVMSATYGVAKNATAHSVRVLNAWGSGSTGGIVTGIDMVANREGTNKIISMSLGGGFSQIFNDAIDSSYNDGTPVVVAAGNSNNDACNGSPGSAEKAITIAASDKSDTKASFSSYGKCTDLYAPGVNILSTQPNDKTAVFSGTSMACPHVAGAMALIMSSGSYTPDQALAVLKSKVSKGVVGNNPAGTPNMLLYTYR
eukprot:153709_1